MEYLKRVLGIEVLYENKALEHLPNFISTRYDSQKVSLSGQKAVFLYPKTELEQVETLKKHLERVKKVADRPVVLVLEMCIRDRYMTENNMKKPDNSLQWAILPGHSTKTEQAPGGLGFSTLLYFLKKNRGEFILISGNEAYELNKNNKDRFNRIEKFFPGTIVTVTINLKDEQAYLYDEATNNVIIF